MLLVVCLCTCVTPGMRSEVEICVVTFKAPFHVQTSFTLRTAVDSFLTVFLVLSRTHTISEV
jgi:hypothetical protein